jgi:putative oxidoreductase
MALYRKIIETHAPTAVVLIRLMVGWVFISEGIQKFINPAEVWAGRFAKIGLPAPEILAPFVGTFEIVCGILISIGFLTRLAVIPTIVIILVAIASTKIRFYQIRASGQWRMKHAPISQCFSARFFCSLSAQVCGLWMRG